MCLINHHFPALTDDEKVLKLQRLLATQKPKAEVKQDTTLKALRLMENEDDNKMFSGLRDKLEDMEREKTIAERFSSGSGREKKQFATPDCLKDLRPDVTSGTNTSGYAAVLTWQMTTQCYQGYYPNEFDEEEAGTRRKRFTSTSRKYNTDDIEEKAKALWVVVSFLWREHTKQGGSDIDKPTRQDVMEAIIQADDDLKNGKCQMHNEGVDVTTLATLKAESMPVPVSETKTKRSSQPSKAPQPGPYA